jgi:hypothetical protein
MLSVLTGATGAKTSARLSSVMLNPSTISDGWGKFSVGVGAHVEVRLEEEGLAGAYWAGTIIETAEGASKGEVAVDQQQKDAVVEGERG